MKYIIKHCIIKNGRFENFIYVEYNNGSVEHIGTYDPHKVYFYENEFIGLTRTQARELMNRRDKICLGM